MMAARPQTLLRAGGFARRPGRLAARPRRRAATSTSRELFVDGEPYGDLTRDDILDNITLSWLTNTAMSAARLYWENKGGYFSDMSVAIPAAVSVFPEELYQAPRSWAERAYPKLIHYNKLAKGGHFAAWEQPELLVAGDARGVQVAALSPRTRAGRAPPRRPATVRAHSLRRPLDRVAVDAAPWSADRHADASARRITAADPTMQTILLDAAESMPRTTASPRRRDRPTGAAIRPFRVEIPRSGARRSAPADLRDALARAGDGRRPVAGRAARDDAGARALLGDATTTGAGARRGSTPCRKFITEIDGLDIHFIHVRSKHANALPIIVTHGWPGSVVEQLKIIGPLTDPTAHGGSAEDAFDVVIPSMPGYGFSGKPTDDRLGSAAHRPRLDRADEAPRLHAVRRAGRRLGRARHRADGRAGAAGTARHPHQHARRRAARNRRGAFSRRARCRPASRPTRSARASSSPSSTRTASATPSRWDCARRRCTAIADSPVGLAAWLLDHDAAQLRAHRARLRRADRRA